MQERMMTSFLKMTSSCTFACMHKNTQVGLHRHLLASLDPRSFPKSFAVRKVWGPDYLLALSVYSVSNTVCLLILDDVLVISATVQTHIFSLGFLCGQAVWDVLNTYNQMRFTACTYSCCWHRCISSIVFLHLRPLDVRFPSTGMVRLVLQATPFAERCEGCGLQD